MATASPITPPPASILEDSDVELAGIMDALAAEVKKGTNWMVRQKTIVDILEGVVASMLAAQGDDDEDLSAEELIARSQAPKEEAADAEEDDSEAVAEMIAEQMPVYIAGILERLNEKQVATAEQAAFYLLSAHGEHREAAETWLKADWTNLRAARKYLRANRRYRELAELIGDPFSETEEGGEEQASSAND